MSNPFDQMPGIPSREEQERIQREQEEVWGRLDNLIHQTFKQNQAGAELLKIWKDTLIMQPTVTGSMTQFEAGIAEGRKEFIRNVILTINKVEAQ